MIKTSPRLLLEYFDTKKADLRSHISSIVAILGEDLGAALFKHYLAGKGAKVEVLNGVQPSTGHTKGPRLDRWIYVKWRKGNQILFQTEIKSWSAYAIGGITVHTPPKPGELENALFKHWTNQWKDINQKKINYISKVLEPMKNKPEEWKDIRIEPLVIYWLPISYKGKLDGEPLFDARPKNSKNFKRIWIFSMSLYLRNLVERKINKISLDMENAEVRMKQLRKILGVSHR